MKAESHLGIWLSPVLRNSFKNLLFLYLKSDKIIQSVYLYQITLLVCSRGKGNKDKVLKYVQEHTRPNFQSFETNFVLLGFFLPSKRRKIPSSLLPLAAEQQHHLWGAGTSLQLAATSAHFCSARWIEISGHNTQARHNDQHFNNSFSKLLITSTIYKSKHFGKKFYQE